MWLGSLIPQYSAQTASLWLGSFPTLGYLVPIFHLPNYRWCHHNHPKRIWIIYVNSGSELERVLKTKVDLVSLQRCLSLPPAHTKPRPASYSASATCTHHMHMHAHVTCDTLSAAHLHMHDTSSPDMQIRKMVIRERNIPE